ncbi:hypothetical protein VL04_17680 [Chromobacterium violaceum]|uniref:hypothetical protein n=1 Tax=Chromobacterium violaceum TaxID=536 RepID=UPI000652F3D5|nr:hypothetical protein [Chromobacterium violaceum]KMN48790.1 hypothetical protein VK93_14945 [Chromobacterium violaceum]KMN87885.1 hypothetical protein VL02_00940 [Chromobacterium violaceum]KMN89114.1 hypothetical protein VL04_17680 [Chromobacterium violaceum]KMO05488.1 hypothetical protein VL16_02925 [Chromobacterium violaceum]
MMQLHHQGDHRPVRAVEYPAIGDQLDVLWRWAAQLPPDLLSSEMRQMLASIQAVKENYPKPRWIASGRADLLEE